MYRYLHEGSRIDGDRIFAVLAHDRADGEEYEKLRGSYDDCDDYVQERTTDDNPESYRVVEVVDDE